MAPRATLFGVRQSARKVRLVVDLIRGKNVNEAYALLKFAKQRAAKQIEKVLKSAVSNAEQDAQRANAAFDVDRLFVSKALANEGPTLKRFHAASMGRATPLHKRTCSVEITVAPYAVRVAAPVVTQPAPRPKRAARKEKK